MNKVLLIVLTFFLAFGLFADDAKVMPAGVFRFYLAPSYAFGSESFDSDGEKVDAGGDYSFVNLGAALEYGVTESITAALQWAPGVNLSSSFEAAEDQTANGLFELFAGAKIQVLGSEGFVKNDKIRFAFAPGVMIPMNFGYDPEEEINNLLTGEEYNAEPTNNAFGLGARVYADYVINDLLFVNLYCEYIKFLEKDAENDFYATLTNVQRAFSGDPAFETVNYGYSLTADFDVNFSKPLDNGWIFGGGLPVSYNTSPQMVYEDQEADSDYSKYTISINPDVSLFMTTLPVPTELQLSYKMPLAGQNTDMAINTLTLQVKTYLKF